MTAPEARAAPLREAERLKLGDLELIIEHGLQTFVRVGAALAQIRDQRLYRAEFDTFEGYCAARWGWSASRARQLIASTQVVASIESVTPGNGPQVEKHARELVGVPEEERAEVYEEAQADARAEGTALATRHVRRAKERRNPARKPKSKDAEEPEGCRDEAAFLRHIHAMATFCEAHPPGRVISSFTEREPSESMSRARTVQSWLNRDFGGTDGDGGDGSMRDLRDLAVWCAANPVESLVAALHSGEHRHARLVHSWSQKFIVEFEERTAHRCGCGQRLGPTATRCAACAAGGTDVLA